MVVVPASQATKSGGIDSLEFLGIDSQAPPFFRPKERSTVFGWIKQNLKVPKRENFSLAFFALSEPIWVCDLGTREKNGIFYQLTPDFDGFWFFAAY